MMLLNFASLLPKPKLLCPTAHRPSA